MVLRISKLQELAFTSLCFISFHNLAPTNTDLLIKSFCSKHIEKNETNFGYEDHTKIFYSFQKLDQLETNLKGSLCSLVTPLLYKYVHMPTHIQLFFIVPCSKPYNLYNLSQPIFLGTSYSYSLFHLPSKEEGIFCNPYEFPMVLLSRMHMTGLWYVWQPPGS